MIATLLCATLTLHDGDSGRCDQARFRLVAAQGPIDAPEMPDSPRCPDRGWCDTHLAYAARDYARAFLASGKAVLICEGRDRFGRRLCRVTVRGVDLGDELVKRGLARVRENWR